MFKIIFDTLNKILNNLDKILIVTQYCSLLVVFLFCVNDSLFSAKALLHSYFNTSTQEGQKSELS